MLFCMLFRWGWFMGNYRRLRLRWWGICRLLLLVVFLLAWLTIILCILITCTRLIILFLLFLNFRIICIINLAGKLRYLIPMIMKNIKNMCKWLKHWAKQVYPISVDFHYKSQRNHRKHWVFVKLRKSLQVLEQWWLFGYLMMILKVINYLLWVRWIPQFLPSNAVRGRLPLKIEHRMQRRYFYPPFSLLHYLSYDRWIVTRGNTVLNIMD